VSFTPAANLTPVSLTPRAKVVAKFAAGVVDTVGKFATGVVDTGGKLPPVLLIPVVHLDLRLSPRIFDKIRNGLNGLLWAEGKLIHEKTRSKKSPDTVPLIYRD
jgi:hypothetical protein